MQICPGDLLVYSRVLTHKASGYGENIIGYVLINIQYTISDMDGSVDSLIVDAGNDDR